MNRQRATRILELALLSAIIGLLASGGVQRFAIGGGGHHARVGERAAQLQTAVLDFHRQWLIAGHRAAVDDLRGFADGRIDSNQHGWPVASDDSNRPPDLNDCAALWRGLQARPPTVTAALPGTPGGDDAEYMLLREADGCLYRYLQAPELAIRYDAARGRVALLGTP